MPIEKSNRASTVQSALCRDICVTGKLGGSEHPEVNGFATEVNGCTPLASLRTNSEKFNRSVRMTAAHILTIPGNRNIPKISDSVIASVPVYVVYDPIRPNAIDIKPCKPVPEAELAINADVNVPSRFRRASRTSSRGLWSSPHSADKLSGFWGVCEQLAQTLCGKIGLSHDTVPSLIGQRPARVISTGGLRYFITQAYSGATGITKCLHEAVLTAAAVCMPANYRRFFNPLGALTPFNAL